MLWKPVFEKDLVMFLDLGSCDSTRALMHALDSVRATGDGY